MKLPSDILHRTPEEAARRIALHFLEEAEHASSRLDDPADAEALHDFRVAIRRLRSTLRAWAPYLKDAVTRKDRRALRRIQNATGEGRNAEVLLEWLVPQRAQLAPRHRVGFDWMVQRLEATRDEAYATARTEVLEAFERRKETLRDHLEVMTVHVHLARAHREEKFADALSQAIQDHASELAKLLGNISKPQDEEAHEARIAGKRLRYLLEPVRELVPSAHALVQRCKELQDLLGELHDSIVLAEELGHAFEAAAAQRARRLHGLALTDAMETIQRELRRSERPGLMELTRRIQGRIETLFTRLRTEWAEAPLDAFIEAASQIANEIARVGRKDLEIERKYLLKQLPPRVLETEYETLDQGYLPGTEVRERVRRVRTPHETKYFRTIKAGRGIQRIEVEEEITAALFDALWPITVGSRVSKRRFRVEDGDLVWEIDEFTDRVLWLAEVELEDADEQVDVPTWLEDFVVRDVTDEAGYVNVRLAK